MGTINGIYGEDNEHMLDPGCFIAVIKRKEMMQFDSLFMIKVAESKGLFGDPDKERNPKEKTEISPAAHQMSRISRKDFKRVKVRHYIFKYLDIDLFIWRERRWCVQDKNTISLFDFDQLIYNCLVDHAIHWFTSPRVATI